MLTTRAAILDALAKERENLKLSYGHLPVSLQQLDYYLSLAGGHPRSLELLLTRLKNPSRSLETNVFVEQWAQELADYCSDASESVVLTVLAKSVLNQAIHLDEVVADGQTGRDLIQATIIINAVNPSLSKRFIPQMSLLRLHHLTYSLGISPNLHNGLRFSSKDLKGLLNIGEMRGDGFEVFHFLMHEFRCWAWHYLEMPSVTTTEKYFNGFTLLRGKHLPVTVPQPLWDRVRLPIYLADYRGDLSGHFLCKNQQKGFDIVHSMGRRLIVEECRFSQPTVHGEETARTLSVSKDIQQKILQAEKQIKSAKKLTISGQKNSIKKTTLLIVAHRSTKLQQTDLQEKLDHTDLGAVLLLKKEDFKLFYGSTFMSLGAFHLSRDDMISIQQGNIEKS